MLWENWKNNWDWILEIAKRRSWAFVELKIHPIISDEQLSALESKLELKYPMQFRETLLNFSAAVDLGWQLEGEEFKDEFKPIFSGGGGMFYHDPKSFVWNFHQLERIHSDYLGWIEDCYNDPNDEYGRHYHNKIPFLDVPNGDLIVFNELGQVVYLSHDDGPLHGCKLGDNFNDFISSWSSLGCIGSESEQFEVFYDKEQMKIVGDSELANKWKSELNKE